MEGIVIAKSADEIAKEVNRLEEERRKAAEKLYYEKQIEAIRGKETKKTAQPVVKSVTINLAMPDLKKAAVKTKTRTKKHLNKRNGIVLAGTACLIAIVFASYSFLTRPDSDSPQVAGSSTNQKADFSPLIPTGVSNQTIAPTICSNNDQLICYEDEYLAGQLNVTQQKLPPGQKLQPTKLLEIAKVSFQQSEPSNYQEIKTKAGNAVVVSYKDLKAQRAVYTFEDRLVFVTTEKSYNQAQWKDYFDSLKVAPS